MKTQTNALQEQLNSLIPLRGFMYAIMADSRIDFLLAGIEPTDRTDVEQLVIQASTLVKTDIAISTAIGIPDETESIIFTAESEVRIIYKLHSIDNYVFIMLGLQKNIGNVALALHQLHTIEPKLKL